MSMGLGDEYASENQFCVAKLGWRSMLQLRLKKVRLNSIKLWYSIYAEKDPEWSKIF